MSTTQRRGVADKTRKRRAADDASNATGTVNQRLNVRIDPAAYQRLMVHCVMSGQQPGKYLESLIDAHCKRWSMPGDLTARATGKVSDASKGEMSQVDATAA
jgi:hypothetical protein